MGVDNAIVVGVDNAIRDYYQTLYRRWGPQHWWPAASQFEVIVGAYLTQNTSWKNVELALAGLRRKKLLSLDGIRGVRLAELEAAIRPAGYFRQKAARLKTFVTFVDTQYGGSLERMLAQPTSELRGQLLGLNGVGPETADSILLCAGQHPVFVVDAYTRRILERHGIVDSKTSYEDIRQMCEQALGEATCHENDLAALDAGCPVPHRPSRMSRAKRTPLAQVYNDLHGLIVNVGKHYCLKSNPKCESCPLKDFLPTQLLTRMNADHFTPKLL